MFKFAEVSIQLSQNGEEVIIQGPYDPINDERDCIVIPREMLCYFIEQLEDLVEKA